MKSSNLPAGPCPAVLGGIEMRPHRWCDHDRGFVFVNRVKAGNQHCYGWQCAVCGAYADIRKALAPPALLARAKPYDPELKERFYSAAARRSKLQREAEQQQWWDNYHAYLDSDKWKSKRRAVLRRAGNRCEAKICCAAGTRAAHVHHLSYERLGDEPLDDLLAVCVPCHEALHGRKIGG